jgi:undecaprenyl-diphosphatase
MNAFEADLLIQINNIFSCDALDFLFSFISLLGNKGGIWIAIALILTLIPKTRKCGICMMISLLFCLIIGNGILKPLFARVRPYNFSSDIVLITEPLSDYSFPSGHTMAAFASAIAMYTFYKKSGIIMLVGAFLMGLSRIYLCMHYPTDVLGGMVFGVLFGIASYKILKKVKIV